MDIAELAERQRLERQRASVRRTQREQSPMQTGVVTRLGDSPTVSIRGGAPVIATSLGGVLRLNQVVIVQSDGNQHWIRGSEAL